MEMHKAPKKHTIFLVYRFLSLLFDENKLRQIKLINPKIYIKTLESLTNVSSGHDPAYQQRLSPSLPPSGRAGSASAHGGPASGHSSPPGSHNGLSGGQGGYTGSASEVHISPGT